MASFHYASKQQVVYQSSTTVKLEERKSVAGLLTEWIVYSPGDIMETETKTIKGFPIMKKTALRLGLVNEGASSEQISAAAGALQGKIETERLGNTNMIRITATTDTAEEAMLLANKVAEVYIEENQMEKAKQARYTRQFIEEQLFTLENRLRETEDRLRQFSEETRNVKLAEPIQQKLISLEFELAELSQKYTDKHPRVIQLKEQIKELEGQIKGFSGQELEYARLSREVDVNKKLYAMLKEKLEEARITEAEKVPDVSVVNPAGLGSPISANKNTIVLSGIVMGLVLGTALAFVLETFDTSFSRIEDVEGVVKLSVLGIVPSFEESEASRKKGIVERLKKRFLDLPADKTEERLVRLSAHYKPSSPSTEAYRNIYTNLKISPSRKTILVTSSSPREGKSSIVCGLGIVMAQAGLKTLLVSTDLRRPALAKTFGIKREPGLNEFIMGSATLEESLKNITDIMLGDLGLEEIRKNPGMENIWILTTGALPHNPTELLGAKGLTTLIEKLRAQFDVLIFDSAPVLPVADASILAPKLDCAIIVYEIGRTSREAIIRTKIQLESVGAKIAGVILNHTRPQVEAISPYPYYYRYKYRYYGKEEAEEKHKKEKVKERV